MKTQPLWEVKSDRPELCQWKRRLQPHPDQAYCGRFQRL